MKRAEYGKSDRKNLAFAAALLALTACSSEPPETRSLAEARQGQDAALVGAKRQIGAAPVPPPGILELVRYPAPKGETSGYLTPAPADGTKRPAIVWVTGGDLSLGNVWSPQPADNDQSAKAFRDAGLMVFYPSLRGLNGNPGEGEGFYGEVDDLVAAANWLKQQPGVDPQRIYLGGHSSGGTLVLLAAEYGGPWKGVFAFGPVADPAVYGDAIPLPIAPDNQAALRLRQPYRWLHAITMPTYIIEGTGGNIDDLRDMERRNNNGNLHFITASGCDHFSVLTPVSKKIAAAIVADKVDAAALAHECG